jgi:hypothetical protein
MGEIAELVARLESADRFRPEVLSARCRLHDSIAAAVSLGTTHHTALQLVDAATTRLRALESGRGLLLARLANVSLYEFWIEVPGYAGPVQGARAQVTQYGDVHEVGNVTGTTRSGIGGAVVGGLLLGPVGAAAGLALRRKNIVKTEVRQMDTRQFELTITGSGFAWSNVEGPNAADGLRRLRDMINARGSTTEDVLALTSAQAAIVDRQTTEARQAEAELQSARTVVLEARAIYDQAWQEYSNRRLPILSDLRARWARTSWPARVACRWPELDPGS